MMPVAALTRWTRLLLLSVMKALFVACNAIPVG